MAVLRLHRLVLALLVLAIVLAVAAKAEQHGWYSGAQHMSGGKQELRRKRVARPEHQGDSSEVMLRCTRPDGTQYLSCHHLQEVPAHCQVERQGC